MKKTKAHNILDSLIKNFNDPVEFFKVLRGIQSEGFAFSIDLLVKLYNDHKEGKLTYDETVDKILELDKFPDLVARINEYKREFTVENTKYFIDVMEFTYEKRKALLTLLHSGTEFAKNLKVKDNKVVYDDSENQENFTAITLCEGIRQLNEEDFYEEFWKPRVLSLVNCLIRKFEDPVKRLTVISDIKQQLDIK